jgi:hypothetical protein
MKKYVIILSLSIFSAISFLYAGVPVNESPFTGSYTASCVNISTTTFVAVPTTASTSRIGIYVTSLSTNTANMGIIYGDSSTPSTMTGYPIVLRPGITQYHGVNSSTILYIISNASASSSEMLCYQEVKQ